jgi:nitrous oxide reductase
MTSIIQDAHTNALAAASVAAQEHLNQHYNGKDSGCCGFAWVTFYPVNKGNTRDGKQERRVFESLGYRKDHTGKAWQLWNPSKNNCQNVDAKYAGAVAYANTFEAESGIKIGASDRLD